MFGSDRPFRMNYNNGNSGFYHGSQMLPPMMDARIPYPGHKVEHSQKNGFPTRFPSRNYMAFNRDNASRGPSQFMDLSKHWVTAYIKSEFAKKEELLSRARTTNQQGDWATFREQNNKCINLYRTAEMEFNNHKNAKRMGYAAHGRAHEYNEKMETRVDSIGAIADTSSSKIFVCDSCERNFPSEGAFNKHMSEHKICGLSGCTFSAHEKIIEKHIQMQHSTGIFERMKDLNSPESISKWIEERKLKFPSRQNIEKRQKEQDELWKKGIRIGERKNKFGKDKKRFERKDPQTWRKEREMIVQKKREKRSKVIQKMQQKLVIDKQSEATNELPPFPGTTELFEVEYEEVFKISDDEDNYDNYIEEPKKVESLVKVNSSLDALMAYGSDCSEDDDAKNIVNIEKRPLKNEKETLGTISTDTEAKIKNEREVNAVESDDEGPLEIKTPKESTYTENIKNEKSIENAKRRKPNLKKKNTRNNTQKFPYEFRPRKISLLEKILDEDIRRERNMILHCVRYTVENNFFMDSSAKDNQASSDSAQGIEISQS